MICVHLDKLRGFEVEKRSAGRNTVSSMCATLVASTWYLQIVVACHVPGFWSFSFSFSQDAYPTSISKVFGLNLRCWLASLQAFVTLQSPHWQFGTHFFATLRLWRHCGRWDFEGSSIGHPVSICWMNSLSRNWRDIHHPCRDFDSSIGHGNSPALP